MTGEWVQMRPHHVCDLPDPGEHVGDRSIWRCECGQRWMLDRFVLAPPRWRHMDLLDIWIAAVRNGLRGEGRR